LQELAEVFQEEGRFGEFEFQLQGRVPDGFIEGLRQTFQRPTRRYRSLR
jgi:hypothetical protein